MGCKVPPTLIFKMSLSLVNICIELQEAVMSIRLKGLVCSGSRVIYSCVTEELLVGELSTVGARAERCGGSVWLLRLQQASTDWAADRLGVLRT